MLRAFEARRTIHVFDGVFQLRFRAGVGSPERSFTVAVALPVAASATASPAPSTACTFAIVFSGRRAFLAWLRLAEAFFVWRACVVILVRDCMLGDGLVGKCRLTAFTWLAATPTTAAPTPSPPTPTTFALALWAEFAFGFGWRESLFFFRLDGFCRFLGRFLDFFDRLDRLLLLRGKIACCFRRMHLLAAVDDIGLLACHRCVG